MAMAVSCFIAPPFYHNKEKLSMERGSTGLACRQAPLVMKEKLSMEGGSTGLACRQALQLMRVLVNTHKGSLLSRHPMQSKSRLIRLGA